MFATLGKGYATALMLGIFGYTALGGPVWLWLLLVWIGGAPITLFFTETESEDHATGKKVVTTRGGRILSRWVPGLSRKTRLNSGS